MVIEESFLQLLKHKPVAKITVTEICARAEINRATFYKHYLDVPDLLEQMEEQIFDQIRTMFGDPEARLETVMVDMLNQTRQKDSRFILLGGENGDLSLMAKTYLLCFDIAYPLLSPSLQQMEENKRKMLIHFLSHGSGGILQYWVHNGTQEDPEEIIQFIFALCSNAIGAGHFPD